MTSFVSHPHQSHFGYGTGMPLTQGPLDRSDDCDLFVYIPEGGVCKEYSRYVQSVDIPVSLGKTVRPQPKWPKVPFVRSRHLHNGTHLMNSRSAF